jgi:ligand-binding sensor domain-containing protein
MTDGPFRISARRIRGWRVCSRTLLAAAAWLIGWGAFTPAQDVFSRFERLTTRDGLASAMINVFLQDADGFLWIGTEDGLQRYDGYSFTTYRPTRGDPYSLSENLVSCLLEDPSGDLWVGTYGGLNRRDRKTGRFQRFLQDPDDPHSLSHNTITALCRDRLGTLWIGTRYGGLNRLDDPIRGRFTQFRHNPADPRSLSSDRVFTILEDRHGRLWVITDGGGINLLDRKSGTFRQFRHDPADPASLPGDRLYTMYEDRRGRFWVGTIYDGLVRFDPETGRCIRYPVESGASPGLSYPYIRQILDDSAGNLWIATYGGGLNRFDPDSARFTVFRHNLQDSGSLAHDQVECLYLDRTGLLWVGTLDGVSRLDLAGKPFRTLRRIPDNPDSLSDDAVWAILEDRAGRLWIGTDGGGLDRYDPATGRFLHFAPHPENPTGLLSDCVQAFLENPDGSIWVATYDGLCLLDPATQRFRQYRYREGDPTALSGSNVMALLRDRRGEVWVGTNHGLNRLNADGRTFTQFLHRDGDPTSLSHDTVFSLCEDRQGRLWVGTNEGGISVLDPDRNAFTQYRNDPKDTGSLGSNVVFALCMDRSGTLWAGTSGSGLNRYNSADGTFTAFTTLDGLPSDVIMGILEDGRGCLWLATLRGLCRFDPRTRSARTFDSSNGLGGDECYQGAVHRGRSGRFFVGTTGGVTFFRPEEIRDDDRHPPLVLTQFKVFNEDYTAGGPPADLRALTLGHRQNSIAFEYTALEFRAPQKILYAYRLDGFDSDWIQAGTRRLAAYTNLDPGAYRFRIKAANAGGRWKERETSVRIEIPPPFWQTTWFRVLGVVLFIGLSNLLVVGARKGYGLVLYWRKSRFISHFRILEKLGRGGMGTVYKVADLNSNQVFALKVMNEELVAAESDRQRFIEESFICEQLDHPNVIRVYEKGEVGNTLYYTMEYFEGKTLQEIMQKGHPTPPVAVLLTKVLFEIFHDIHGRGVIHRDVKPGNIMLGKSADFSRTGGGRITGGSLRANVKILDFGLARFLDSRTLTQTGSFVGSLQYMAPEMMKGVRGRTPECDYYSLGVILYEMLTGRLPYAGQEFWEIVFAIVRAEVPEPATIRPEIPPALSTFVLELIQADPARRLTDYDRIVAGLEEFLSADQPA